MLCELALVLAIDVSGSVIDEHYELQRNATADAVEQVIKPNENLPIALSVIMWGHEPIVVVPWRMLRDRSDTVAFASELRRVSRPITGMTHMVAALEKSLELLSNTPCEPERKMIDISGDGESDDGDPSPLRNMAQELFIQINGLPITTRYQSTDIVQYFRERVLTYDGFLMTANEWNGYARAIRGKLTLEIAGSSQ